MKSLDRLHELNTRTTLVCVIVGIITIVICGIRLSYLNKCPVPLIHLSDFAEGIFLGCLSAYYIVSSIEIKALRSSLPQTEELPVNPEVTE